MPCPFCKRKQVEMKSDVRHVDGQGEIWISFVSCNSCHARGPALGGAKPGSGDMQAAGAWNTRWEDPPLPPM